MLHAVGVVCVSHAVHLITDILVRVSSAAAHVIVEWVGFSI